MCAAGVERTWISMKPLRTEAESAFHQPKQTLSSFQCCHQDRPHGRTESQRERLIGEHGPNPIAYPFRSDATNLPQVAIQESDLLGNRGVRPLEAHKLVPKVSEV